MAATHIYTETHSLTHTHAVHTPRHTHTRAVSSLGFVMAGKLSRLKEIMQLHAGAARGAARVAALLRHRFAPSSLPPLPLSTRATWSWATLTSAQTPAASDRDNAEFVISPATTTTRRTWQATEGGVARREGACSKKWQHKLALAAAAEL